MNKINWSNNSGLNALEAAYGNNSNQKPAQPPQPPQPPQQPPPNSYGLGENFTIANETQTFLPNAVNLSGPQVDSVTILNDSGPVSNNSNLYEINASSPSMPNGPPPPPSNNWSMKNLFPNLQVYSPSGPMYSPNAGPATFETLKKASRPTRKRMMKRLEELNGIVDSIESSLFFGMKGGMKGGGNANEYWNHRWNKNTEKDDPSPPNTATTQQEANFEALFQKPQKYLRKITKRMRRIQRALDIIRH
jgi:hypothetical protein